MNTAPGGQSGKEGSHGEENLGIDGKRPGQARRHGGQDFRPGPETMAEVRDAINARAFRRQAFREYLQAARPPWKRYEDW